MAAVEETRGTPLSSGEDGAALWSRARWLAQDDGRGRAPTAKGLVIKKKKRRRRGKNRKEDPPVPIRPTPLRDPILSGCVHLG